MKKSVKYILYPVVVLALIYFVSPYAFDWIFSGMCGNDIINEIVSPDGKNKAVLFQRDCGATTSLSTQISIISANKELPNDIGNIFIIVGYSDINKIDITWQSPSKVEISNIPPKTEIYKKEHVFNNIEIKYSNR